MRHGALPRTIRGPAPIPGPSRGPPSDTRRPQARCLRCLSELLVDAVRLPPHTPTRPHHTRHKLRSLVFRQANLLKQGVDPSRVSVGALKQHLHALGISFDGMLEKSELVARLNTACLATGGWAAQTNATLPPALSTASSPPLPAGSGPAHSLNTSGAEGPSEVHKAVASPLPALPPQFRPPRPNDTPTGVTNLGTLGQAAGDPRDICRPPVEDHVSLHSPPKVMTEEEAHRLAEADGISLVLAPGSDSGYKGVSRNNKPTISRNSGYCAQFCQNGKIFRLGSFSGAPEAALAYARHLKAVTAMKRRQQVEEFTRS